MNVGHRCCCASREGSRLRGNCNPPQQGANRTMKLAPHDETLLILGASVRAAAQSARRAQIPVMGIDLFGDADLLATCPSIVTSDYPAGLFAAAQHAPPGPWLFTGGLENDEPSVSAFAMQRELLGVRHPECVRDLIRLNALLRDAELSPICSQPALQPPTAGKWLLKPRRGSGGHRIRVFTGPPYAIPDDDSAYWMPWIDGLAIGAVFVIAPGQWRLLGVCEQLPGADWTGARGMTYAGSIGPLTVSEETLQGLARLGERLCHEPGLCGLIGVDAMLTSQQTLQVLEINPRYTASVEVLERALGLPAIPLHLAACRDGQIRESLTEPAGQGSIAGKAVLYARRPLQITARFCDYCQATNEPAGDWPLIADLPHIGTQVDAGHPIVTIFASGDNIEEVRDRLRRRADDTFSALEN